MKFKLILKSFLLVSIISIGATFAADITCNLDRRDELDLDPVTYRVSQWTCSDGCSYVKTSVSLFTESSRLIISDVSTCN